MTEREEVDYVAIFKQAVTSAMPEVNRYLSSFMILYKDDSKYPILLIAHLTFFGGRDKATFKHGVYSLDQDTFKPFSRHFIEKRLS